MRTSEKSTSSTTAAEESEQAQNAHSQQAQDDVSLVGADDLSIEERKKIKAYLLTLNDFDSEFRLSESDIPIFKEPQSWSMNEAGLRLSTAGLIVLSNLPSSITSLDISQLELRYLAPEAITQLAKAIPSSITALSVEEDGLSEQALKNFAKSLPSTITHLSIAHVRKKPLVVQSLIEYIKVLPSPLSSLTIKNACCTLSNENAIVFAQALPKHLDSLVVSYICLSRISEEKASEFAKNLPKTLTSLTLRRAGLLKKSFIESLPALTSLDISYNLICDGNTDGLIEILTALPSSVNALNLTSTDINTQGTDGSSGWAKLAENLPHTVTALDISNNSDPFDDELLASDLIQFAKGLPESLQSLTLEGFELELLTVILQSLPKSIVSLNLMGNEIGYLKQTELLSFAAALPPQLSSLNLSRNKLEQMTTDRLIQFATALPTSLRSITIDDIVFYQRPTTDLLEFLKALPSLQAITINDSVRERNNSIRLADEINNFQLHLPASYPEKELLKQIQDFRRGLVFKLITELWPRPLVIHTSPIDNHHAIQPLKVDESTDGALQKDEIQAFESHFIQLSQFFHKYKLIPKIMRRVRNLPEENEDNTIGKSEASVSSQEISSALSTMPKQDEVEKKPQVIHANSNDELDHAEMVRLPTLFELSVLAILKKGSPVHCSQTSGAQRSQVVPVSVLDKVNRTANAIHVECKT